MFGWTGVGTNGEERKVKKNCAVSMQLYAMVCCGLNVLALARKERKAKCECRVLSPFMTCYAFDHLIRICTVSRYQMELEK